MRARAHIEELRGGKSAIIVTELPYGVRKGGDIGVIKKIADLVQREGADRDLGSRRPQRPDRDADPDRAQARRDPAGGAEQALQAHLPAGHVRLQRSRARRRRPADALAARARPALPRLPARDRHAALAARAAPGRAARPHPARLPDRARQPRRGDRADPGRRRRGRGARRADGALRPQRAPGLRDPRHAARAAHRARAQGGRGRVPQTSRSGSASCASCSRTRPRSTPSSGASSSS